MPFEILNGALVLFGSGTRLERTEVAAPAGLRIDLAGIEPVLAGLQFADHGALLCSFDENDWREDAFLADQKHKSVTGLPRLSLIATGHSRRFNAAFACSSPRSAARL